MKRNIMTSTFFALMLLLTISLFTACEDNMEKNERDSNPQISRLGEELRKLEDLRDESKYGKKKGQYPEASKAILNNAMADAGRLILKINAGTSVSQAEIDQTIAAGEKAIIDFKGTILQEDVKDPLVPAELFVDGEKDGYIDFGTSPDYSKFGAPGAQAFTIELWIKLERSAGFGAVVSTYKEDGSEPRYRKGWMINHYNNDFMRVSFGLNTFNLWEPGDGFNEMKRWKHVAAVYNDKGVDGEIKDGKPVVIKLYFDGNLVRTFENGDATEYYNSADDLNSAMTAFLQFDKDGNKGRKVSGYIKDFRIWKAAKSNDQIKKLKDKEIKVAGTEADLVCAWPFDTTVDDNEDIKDLTGRHTAKLQGDFRWNKLEQ